MEYKYPPLPEKLGYVNYWPDNIYTFDKFAGKDSDVIFTGDQMRQYAAQAVAPLLAEIERLEVECGAWRLVFPRHEYRIIDECVALKFEYR